MRAIGIAEGIVRRAKGYVRTTDTGGRAKGQGIRDGC